MKSYAGIGSRETPEEICHKMTRIAQILSSKYTLRSGGAKGADTAFEKGAGNNKEIYLPGNTLNGRRHDNLHYFNYEKMPGVNDAVETVGVYHPAGHRLSRLNFHFHARNAMQILGRTMKDPVEFVVCWTPEGRSTGGTGQALRIASALSIPIYNLAKPNLFYFFKEF
jgi:hypothetical protein